MSATLAPEAPAAFASVPLASIDESPFNPRRRYDPAQMADLEQSIRAHGVITPVIVRRVGDRFELAAGHRRFRASKAVGLEAMPAVVRIMDDAQLREVLAIENLQRADVHPLDEAAAFASMRAGGWSISELAARLGKSEGYVRRRLALDTLVDPWPSVFDANGITLEALEAVARLTPEAQVDYAQFVGREWKAPASLKAWRDAQTRADDDVADDEELEEDSVDPVERLGGQRHEVLQLHDVRAWTASRRLASTLARVPWPLDDATLAPKAGACLTCVKRTGAEPALWPELGDDDCCLDAKCLKGKREAWVRRQAALAEQETGVPVVLVRASRWGAQDGIRGAAALPSLEGRTEYSGVDGGQVPAIIADGPRLGERVYIKPVKESKGTKAQDSSVGGAADFEAKQRERRARAEKRVAIAKPIVERLLAAMPKAKSSPEMRQLAAKSLANTWNVKVDLSSDAAFIASIVAAALQKELGQAANEYSTWSIDKLKPYATAIGADWQQVRKPTAETSLPSHRDRRRVAAEKPVAKKPKRTLRELRAAKKKTTARKRS